MATFTPPTFNVPWVRQEKRDDRFWRYYDGIPTGYSVLITGSVASTYPGVTSPSQDDIEAADAGSGVGGYAAFIGGRTYTITDAEAFILIAAGYNPSGGAFGAGFGAGFDLVD